MEVNRIPAVTKTQIVVIEPERFELVLTREELQAVTDDINRGTGVDWISPAGRLSTAVWEKCRLLLNEK